MTLTKLIELQDDSYRDYINSGKAPDFLDFVMDFDFAALDEKIKRYEEALRIIADDTDMKMIYNPAYENAVNIAKEALTTPTGQKE